MLMFDMLSCFVFVMFSYCCLSCVLFFGMCLLVWLLSSPWCFFEMYGLLLMLCLFLVACVSCFCLYGSLLF